MLKTFLKNSPAVIRAVLVSRKFFWAIIIFFMLEALWFVFSMHYPLAFDERTHFGLIQVYAQQWLPFLDEQAAGNGQFGVVARDPSYLFHYALSFPYRLIAIFTDNQTVQVIILRLLNVAMFTGGLLLFIRVLRRAGSSRALTHTALAVFVLVPIVPYLAAHINYDNLVFLLLPLLLLLAFRLVESFREQLVDTKTILLFVIGCLTISIVKFAATVLLVPIVAFLVFEVWRSFRGHVKRLPTSAANDYRQLSLFAKSSLIIVLVIVGGLFLQRYGGNLVSYGELNPGCNKVLTVEQCLEYGPWARDYHNRQKSDGFDPNPVVYAGEWLWGMWHRSFFAVAGRDDNFANSPGLPVPKFTAILLAVFGLIAVMVRFRATFRGHRFLQMLAVMGIFYCVVLWIKLYNGSYSVTGVPVAINGRYLIPILLPLAAVMGNGIRIWMKNRPHAKPYLAAGTILLFLYGGGVFTYLILSKQPWLWQHNVVLQTTDAVRNALSLFIWH